MATLSSKIRGLLLRLEGNFQRYYCRLPMVVRTIRFKLSFLYSTIFSLFAGSLLLSFNLYLGKSLARDPERHVIQINPFSFPPEQFLEDFNGFRAEEKQRIRDIRLNDLRRVQLISIYSLIPLALISFGIGYYVSGQFLSPIARLRNDIEKLQTRDLGRAFTSEEDDEVGALITSFNELSKRLQEAFYSQEQFVQNASHELRTPLAIIQTNLDTALDDPNISTGNLKKAITQALIGVNQLKHLVNYLLQLTAPPQKNLGSVKHPGQARGFQASLFNQSTSSDCPESSWPCHFT